MKLRPGYEIIEINNKPIKETGRKLTTSASN